MLETMIREYFISSATMRRSSMALTALGSFVTWESCIWFWTRMVLSTSCRGNLLGVFKYSKAEK